MKWNCQTLLPLPEIYGIISGMENALENVTAAENAGKAPAIASGRVLGKWRVVRLLGRGGMAEVYEVEDFALGSRYALKLFTYERSEKESARERFFAEGRLLAKFDHPRLVRVYDLGEDTETGRPYFIMDLVLGPGGVPQTLADADIAGADEDQVAIWYEDLREGLAYVHGKGILHRDLKLQNVLIGPDGHAVLSDFGVAKIFDPGLREKLGLSLEQTLIAVKDGHKTVMGSVGYMAPEVEMGMAASKQSDWYALGVMIFRLLTGVWCDARTDVLGDLDTYSPVWRDILPKLLHANPSGRDCPSWRKLEKAYREKEAYRAEKILDVLRVKRHDAVRGRRNAWIAATCAALVAAALACFIQHLITMRPEPPPDFESVVCIPPNALREYEPDVGNPFALARIDAWVLTHGLFTDLRDGKITREKAIGELRRLLRVVKEEDDLLLEAEWKRVRCDQYSQVGDWAVLSSLLQSAISNLTAKTEERK